MGYEGLSGIFAIEFDMMASNHNDLPINKNLMISIQSRNTKT